MTLDICLQTWNHPHNQYNEHVHHPKVFSHLFVKNSQNSVIRTEFQAKLKNEQKIWTGIFTENKQVTHEKMFGISSNQGNEKYSHN